MIHIILGTRSEVIKFSSLIGELQKRNLPFKILNTGQHGQQAMIKWIKKLNLPPPDINTGESLRMKWSKKGLCTSVPIFGIWATKKIFQLIRIFRKEKPKIVMYQGDTIMVPLTALAARLSLSKILLVHRESGMRSHNLLEPLPEEFNRRIADKFTDIHFCPTPTAVKNLKEEHAHGEIYYVGDPLIEIVDHILKKFKKPEEFKKYENFIAVSLHRFENINNPKKMSNIVKVLEDCPFNLVFPLNLNTRRKLERYNLLERLKNLDHIYLTDPIAYIDWINLIKDSEGIITDSGGLQEEASILKIPCILTRNLTEWKELVDIGASVLTGFDTEKILCYLDDIKNKGEFYQRVKKAKCPLGDGKATERMVDILERCLNEK